MTDEALLSNLFGDGARTRNMVGAMGGTRTAVYLALLYLRTFRGPVFRASVAELSALTRYSNYAVRRALIGLVAIGFIRRGPADGVSREYTIVERVEGGSAQMERTPSRVAVAVL